MNRTMVFRIACLFAFASAACSSSSNQSNGSGGSGPSDSGGSGGSTSGGSGGSTSSGSGGSTTSSGGHTGSSGSGGSSSSGSGGSTSSGSGGSTSSGSGGSTSSGSGGSDSSGSGGSGSGGAMAINLPPLVTSALGAYWKTDGTLSDASSGSADVTVNDGTTKQTWEGFGGAFNEIGWSVLTSQSMQDTAMKLLFSPTDGAAFVWGRIPMGASDYAKTRYTCDDNGDDPAAMSSGSNRPAADTSLNNFSLKRDEQMLIPYIHAAQKVNPNIRFWSSPWTPPVWMKTGYKTDDGSGGTAKKPSYYDGGSMVNNADNLKAYAQYYKDFVEGYMKENPPIKIEYVSPQNEPGYDQNYPSCLWDKATYVAWIGQYLGPAMKDDNVKVMLGTLSNAGDNNRTDLDISSAVLADSTAKSFLAVVGVQWGVLDKVNGGQTFSGLPIWATEHKCGNYPWNPSGYPKYNSSQAPNDQAYGQESWGYIRDAITKGGVTAYNAWNMVLDKSGLGIDTSRDWKQDALLVADGGNVNPTPAYYVFRHFSQYVVPGAKVVTTTGGDAVAFKNPDGSLVAVMFSSSAKSNYTVKIGGKMKQFSMPANGWATVYVTP